MPPVGAGGDRDRPDVPGVYCLRYQVIAIALMYLAAKLSKFETEHAISFIPPDGEHELMRSVYRWRPAGLQAAVKHTRYPGLLLHR